MDDRFMLSGLRKPSPAFARALSDRLALLDAQVRADAKPASVGAGAGRRPVLKAALWAGTVLIALSLFSLPSVRAGAKAFLDMFRVVNFAPVRVSPDRIAALQTNFDLPQLFSDQVEVLQKPAPPVLMTSVAAAAEAAGIRVREPTWKPIGLELKDIHVAGESAVRMTISVAKIRGLLDSIGIDDIDVSDAAEGKTATFRMPRAVSIQYRSEKRSVTLVQGKTPEVSFPAGIDLTSVAEAALRLMGIDRTEARRFARNVDWRTTLLVPVPADVTKVSQVDVQGNAGLLMERIRTQPKAVSPVNSIVMWSANGSVYVLGGNIPATELFEMAQSMQ